MGALVSRTTANGGVETLVSRNAAEEATQPNRDSRACVVVQHMTCFMEEVGDRKSHIACVDTTSSQSYLSVQHLVQSTAG